MKKLKKALVGTVLAGSLVVGAGFGTYSWFTDSATVSGEVTNSIIKISPSESQYTLTVMDGYDKLAPSRYAISDWVTLENESTENVRVTGTYTATISPIEENVEKYGHVSLSDYRAAALFIFNGNKNFSGLGQGNNAQQSFINYLETGELPRGNVGTLRFLTIDEDATIEEIEELMSTIQESEEDIAVIALGNSVSKTINISVVNSGNSFQKYMHTRYGVSLVESAGNQYQDATFDAVFNITLSQLDQTE